MYADPTRNRVRVGDLSGETSFATLSTSSASSWVLLRFAVSLDGVVAAGSDLQRDTGDGLREPSVVYHHDRDGDSATTVKSTLSRGTVARGRTTPESKTSLPFGCALSCAHGGAAPPSTHVVVGYGSHTHEFFEIVVFDRAGGFHGVLGQQAEEIRKGQVWMLPPGTAHDLTDLGDATGWLVLLGPEQLAWPTLPISFSRGWRSPWCCRSCKRTPAGRPVPIQLTAEMLRRWKGWLCEMETELAARRLGYSQAVAATLDLLLISAARLSPQQANSRADPLVTRAFEIVDERFRQSLTLRDIAEVLHVTSGHLTEVVRRRTGRPLGEWILQRRMTQARFLLGETETLVADVAAQCGFTTVGHFGRQFRRLHGMSPSTWRSSASGYSSPRAGESS